MRLIFAASIAFAMSLGNAAVADETTKDWDPRLVEALEISKIPADLQARTVATMQDALEADREATIRLMFWAAHQSNAGTVNDTFALARAMLITVEGCLLPVSFCDRVREDAKLSEQVATLASGLSLLSGAVVGLSSGADCQSDRAGFVDGPIFDWGETAFVSMSTSSEPNSDCFVRKLET